jgi:hypothetical protein
VKENNFRSGTLSGSNFEKYKRTMEQESCTTLLNSKQKELPFLLFFVEIKERKKEILPNR